ncbi:MAG: c-type cytochrome biogenesis protein CcsB, partial [Geobacter sp.]
MLSAKLFNITTIFYMASTLAFFIYLAGRNQKVGLSGSVLAWIGFAIHTVATGLRWKESYDIGLGHAPLSNLYESVVFFAWSIVLIFGIIDAKYKYRVIGVFVMPFALLGMTWAQLYLPADINPLMPALQSNWLTYHVITCFLGYAAFAVACGVSIMYLIKVQSEEKATDAAGGILSLFPPTKVLDDLNYKAIMVGFPLLTLGIITGAAWANYAWGTYWSWDPKETWSLIVWFVYAAFLHARFTKGWVGRRAAWLSIIGFAATIFCY